jgi:hypothetical protein
LKPSSSKLDKTQRRVFLGALPFFFTLPSCRKNKYDPKKITLRPRVYLEGSASIPLFDEYDFTSVQVGTVDNIFSDNPEDRIYAIWFGLDRRSSMALQKETIGNVGKRFQLAIAGQIIGIHPIENGISNGVLPFLLSESMTKENVNLLLQELNLSLYHIRGELEQNK